MEPLPIAVPAMWRRMLDAYHGLSASSWAIGGLLCALMIVALFRPPGRWTRYHSYAQPIALAWTVALSVAGAWRLAWLSDDAFISFRYARNLVEGHGLVFNPGERVEGYTNFLWTMLMAAGIAVRAHPGQAAIVAGLASMAAVLVLVARTADAVASRRSPPILSIAAVLLGGSYLFASYGTSGLETMAGTAFVLLALDRAVRRAPLQSGLAGVAAMLTRPDHAIFYASLALALSLDRSRRRELVRYVIPFAAVYLPYFVLRWSWYGDVLPNTFYAKSGAGSYLSQGVTYLLLCSLGSGLLGLLPLAAAGALHLRRHLVTRFALLAIPLYLIYVARIGGDFMLGRLLVPVIPLVAILAEAGARRLVALRRPALAALGVVAASLAVLPIRIVSPSEKRWQVADERTFYRVTSFAPLVVDSPFWSWADELIDTYGTGPSSPTVATGCVGIVGYRTMAPMLDIFGLTDKHVAHLPLAGRGRPGHEKLASPAYLLERGVDIADVDAYPPEYLPYFQLPSHRIPIRLVRWNPTLAAMLRRHSPGAVADLPSALTSYQPPAGDSDRFACDLWFFEDFFFSLSPSARRPFFKRLASEGHLPPQVASFLSAGVDESPPGWTEIDSLSFDPADRSDWISVGSSFRTWPTRDTPPGQSEVGHRHGPLLDTYDAHDGDGASGSIQSAPFELRGDILSVRIGGGMSKADLAALLVVDGRIVAASTGCNSEVLSRRAWDVHAWRGKQARLVVIDNVTTAWGHLVVDDLRQWERAR